MFGVLGGIVRAPAGVGAYLEASLGGPGTTAFVVRLFLVALAVVGALLIGLALRVPRAGTEVPHFTAPEHSDRER